jgi:adenine specific DNA methylase Mod
MSKSNALFYGDNLVWLRDHKYFPDESVDLIYLDPPFNSKADYNLIFNEPGKLDKSQAQIKAFDDTWHWESEASAIALDALAHSKPQIAVFISWLSHQGKDSDSMAAYLSMMAVRLMELHRVLKSSVTQLLITTRSYFWMQFLVFKILETILGGSDRQCVEPDQSQDSMLELLIVFFSERQKENKDYYCASQRW